MEGRTSELEPSRAAGRWRWRWTRRWPYSCPTREAAEHLRLLMLIFLLFVLSERPVQCCCVDEPRPTSECSFASYSQSRAHVACILKDYRRNPEGCYSDDHLTTNNDEIPGRVEDLEVSYYYTQCEQSLMEVPGQTSDRCPANCNENNGMSYTAINITFKLNSNSASKLSALEIKLYGHSGGFHKGKTWCVLYEYGKGNVTYNDAVNHVFHYDGFLGLVPQYEYEVFVRTLPTARVKEDTWVKYKIKTRTCWSPFISWHSTPFAVDFDLTMNSEGYYKKHIYEYYIAVYSSDNTSSIRHERTVQNIGNATQQIVFRCFEPGIYTVEIQARGTCESCLPYLNERYTVPGGLSLKISTCPGNITMYAEVGENVSVTWPSPSAMSSCPNLAPIKTKQSHSHGDVFQEGTSTEVRYEFWQYDQDDKATCSFYVHIMRDPIRIDIVRPPIKITLHVNGAFANRTVAERPKCLTDRDRPCTHVPVVIYTDPPVVTCSNVTLRPQSPNTFNGLIEGESYIYSDSNPDLNGITYNFTKGISGDLFPPGHTSITLVAVDTFGNSATCLFYVENSLTELPVNCPSLNHSVSTDPGKKTYTFLPNLGEANITKSVPGYRYHGGDVFVDVTIGGSAPGSSVSIGTHEVVAIISDDVLTKTCKGFYSVMDVSRQPPSVPVAVLVVAIIGAVIGIALAILLALFTISSCTREPGKSRFETCKQKLRQLTGKAFEDPKSEVGFSHVKQGEGIDIDYLKYARSEFSSANNINNTNVKVITWINRLDNNRDDSGIERSKELDHVTDHQEEYHDQRRVFQVHECEVHAASGEKQLETGYFDSGMGASYSQEHLHLHSDSEDEKDEERLERNDGTKRPLLYHRDISLANSDIL